MIFQSFCFCFVPLLIIFAVFYASVPNLKFPAAILSVLAGFLAIIPVGLLTVLVFPHLNIKNQSLSAVLIQDLLMNGFVEELFKMLFIFIFVPKKLDLKTFFICSLLAGFSVGCFELLIYFPSWSENVLLKFILRIFTAVLLHAFCAGLSGIFVYSIKINHTQILPFVFAFVFHGIYNYFAGFKLNVPFFYFSFAVVAIAAIECRVRYTRLQEAAC